MSKLSEYSKFDHLLLDGGDDDDVSGGGGGNRIERAGADEHAAPSVGSAVGAAPSPGSDATSDPIRTKMTKKNDDGRYVFECDGRKIYEWEQSLEGTSYSMRTDPLWPVAVGTVSPFFGGLRLNMHCKHRNDSQ